MINVSEIMVGNYASDPNFENQIVEILRINKYYPNDCRVDEGGYSYDVDLRNLTPIQLTPELLIDKCGFNRAAYSKNDYCLGKFRLTHVHLTGNFCFAVGDGQNPTPIKHLHQLQNLYYAITHKILEVKLLTTNG